MSQGVKVIVCGQSGSGKSTVARTISIALRQAGFCVSLSDQDDISEDQYEKRKQSLSGGSVGIIVENVK